MPTDKLVNCLSGKKLPYWLRNKRVLLCRVLKLQLHKLAFGLQLGLLRQHKRLKTLVPALMHRKQLAQLRLKQLGLQLQLHKLQHDKRAFSPQLALLRQLKRIKIQVQMHRKQLAQVRLKH